MREKGSSIDRQEHMTTQTRVVAVVPQVRGTIGLLLTLAVSIDERGTVTVEYAVLLSLVAIGCSLATVALGAPLVRLFMSQEVWLWLAVP